MTFSQPSVSARETDVQASSIDPSTPVITSAALVTAMGSTDQTWTALLEGRFISDHARVPIETRDGEARVVTLANAVVAEASATQHRSGIPHAPERSALVVGTSKGPIEQWLAPPLHMANTPYVGGGLMPAGLGEIADRLGGALSLHGPRLTVSAACASGLIALIRGAMLIRNNEADRVLVVAAEASVHPLFVGSFRRLGVLPKANNGCRPFDKDRDGFLMSEAAAAVWLLRANCLPTQPVGNASSGRVVIDRFSFGADASHLTGMDPTGRVLRRILKETVGDRPLDLIHAHGTGTILNDPVELAAINDAIASHAQVPEIYSHKGALGHSLGASGLVSIAINYLIHSHGMVPPNPNTPSPIPSGRLRIHSGCRQRKITRSLAIAAGFGGSIAAVALRSV